MYLKSIRVQVSPQGIAQSNSCPSVCKQRLGQAQAIFRPVGATVGVNVFPGDRKMNPTISNPADYARRNVKERETSTPKSTFPQLISETKSAFFFLFVV